MLGCNRPLVLGKPIPPSRLSPHVASGGDSETGTRLYTVSDWPQYHCLESTAPNLWGAKV